MALTAPQSAMVFEKSLSFLSLKTAGHVTITLLKFLGDVSDLQLLVYAAV
jgi:hypothetical protein